MDIEEARELQTTLAPLVEPYTPEEFSPRIAAGLDIAYATDSDQIAAAAVCIDINTLTIVDSSVVHGQATFPYISGLLGFRELPHLLEALNALSITPDILMCDGQGVAHPRRFGIACHAGITTGIPSIGIGKTPLGHYSQPGPNRGDWTPLIDGEEVIGRALRTQHGTKPVFVSIGHRIDLDTACNLVLQVAPRYRQPETIRAADSLARRKLKV
jgi:deoxyribonuclease V